MRCCLNAAFPFPKAENLVGGDLIKPAQRDKEFDGERTPSHLILGIGILRYAKHCRNLALG